MDGHGPEPVIRVMQPVVICHNVDVFKPTTIESIHQSPAETSICDQSKRSIHAFGAMRKSRFQLLVVVIVAIALPIVLVQLLSPTGEEAMFRNFDGPRGKKREIQAAQASASASRQI